MTIPLFVEIIRMNVCANTAYEDPRILNFVRVRSPSKFLTIVQIPDMYQGAFKT